MVRDTSIEAYHELVSSGVFGEQVLRVYAYIAENPNVCDRDIRFALQMEQATAASRRNELLNEGAVIATDRVIDKRTKKWVYLWSINPKATTNSVLFNRESIKQERKRKEEERRERRAIKKLTRPIP